MSGWVEFELASETPADDVANITVSQAATRLGVSDGRVRQLAREGRVRGAAKNGAEWLVPTPVELIPGRRGPAGVAGRVDAAGVGSPLALPPKVCLKRPQGAADVPQVARHEQIRRDAAKTLDLP